MQLLLVLALFPLSATAFRGSLLRNPSFALSGNKIDSISIDGDLTPVSNNVLIKVKEVAVATAGGIFIPDNAKERPTQGLVVAAGPGRIHPETAVLINMAVSVGDSVLYGKYDGTELKYNDEAHQLIKDDDVLLKYTGNEATFDNVIPVKDNVLIELASKDATSMGGIIMNTPTAEKKRPDYGTVAKVGSGRQAGNGSIMTIQVKPGDGVRFRDFAGSEVKLDGKEYLVIKAYDILAKW